MWSPTERVDNIHRAKVGPDAVNDSHAMTIDLVGHNKRVLELGPAAAPVTRALVARGCQVVGIEIDVTAPAPAEAIDAEAVGAEGFDVVVAGDVLAHLADPLSVLRSCRAALRPGGWVVLSLPNMAHADVTLQRLGSAQHEYAGRLDQAHLRFFTRESMEDLVRDAGLLTVDLRRVLAPVFHTDLAVRADSVTEALLAEVLDADESETCQFVVRAVVDDGDAAIQNLASRAVFLQTSLERERAERVVAESEREAALAMVEDLKGLHEEALRHARGFEQLSEDRQRHIDAMQSTRSYRMLEPLRSLFGRRG